ncbi:zinc ribbon domain-containing protein [Priestia megaterium]|uniref:double zinc ribbon domain-containing protein n=1 Tax=Priestia megaterium TaxID=1404 RepID=UPI002FFE281F
MSDFFRRLLGDHHDDHHRRHGHHGDHHDDHHRHHDDHHGHHDYYEEPRPYRYEEPKTTLRPSNMLVCRRCKASNDVSHKFCYECGDRLQKDPVVCPKCNNTVMGHAKFCQQCGTSIR